MSSTPDRATPTIVQLFEQVREEASTCDEFDQTRIEDGRVVVHASETPPEVFYRIDLDEGRLYVEWVSEDRYISQSIEAELMWTGDDLDDLIDEELIDTGWSHGRLGEMQHFRNEAQLFTFRSPILVEIDRLDAPSLVGCLLAYHRAFSELGDMKPDEE